MSTINETLELLDFAKLCADESKKALANDGKIDLMEIGMMVKNLAPEAIKAGYGTWLIPAELADLDKEEAKELVTKSLLVIFSFVELFTKIATSK